MGSCLSSVTGGRPVLENPDGDLATYVARFEEEKVLGQGEFGVVKLVHDKTDSDARYACKTLQKGVIFKDNTIYPAMPPEILRGEVEMLRTLAGQSYCMNLVAVYETPKALLMVTECCSGGEMMEWVSKQESDLRTEDISRISFQLLSAVDHCYKNNVFHRDVKPENTMFTSESAGAELRLIDFGSGTNKVVEGVHTTFAGTPFYNSPEMFQKTYTILTDVWSVGVTLYVLVAGYPAEVLQKAFNLLQSSHKDLRKLPGLPDDMPDSYFEMLDGLLVYRHKQRKTAGEMLDHDFVQFHKDLAEEEKSTTEERRKEDESGLSPRKERLRRTSSIVLPDTVQRHSMFLDFKKFERELTTIIATMLDRYELHLLITLLKERFNGDDVENSQLQVIYVCDLRDILRNEIDNDVW